MGNCDPRVRVLPGVASPCAKEPKFRLIRASESQEDVFDCKVTVSLCLFTRAGRSICVVSGPLSIYTELCSENLKGRCTSCTGVVDLRGF